MEEQVNQIEIPNRPLSGNQQLNWREIRTFRFWCLLQKKLCLGAVFDSAVFCSDFRVLYGDSENPCASSVCLSAAWG